MSVIVGRALPDVRDGLKPVHRRVLYTMHEQGNDYNKPYRKSARLVGDVMGKYHPHGDSAIYDTVVRLAQDFSMRYQLVDGQGNFGSIDGDSAAAMRYTEMRMKRLSHELMADLDKDTVNFIPNYDGSLNEPQVLPSKIPNLLTNGSTGIAVGMACNIPPHNLTEVMNALLYYMDHRDSATLPELMEHMPGPDFPTGGSIMGRQGIYSAYSTGRGILHVRAKAHFEQTKEGRDCIIVTELPFMVNKARLIEKMADLVRSKKLEGISDLRDESDRTGMRIFIQVKRGENTDVVLSNLYKHTAMQSSFGVIMLAIVNRQPKILSLPQVLNAFLEHRIDVVTRRTRYELRQAEARMHILEGLMVALSNLDAVLEYIRQAESGVKAQEALMQEYGLSQKQAHAILDMKLHRLTGLEQGKIKEEHHKVGVIVEDLKKILLNENLLLDIIREECVEVRDTFGDERRTQLLDADSEILIEELINEEDMVLTITHSGYIKRSPSSEYRAQNRGGKGRQGMTTKGEDFVEKMFVASTHDFLLVFTTRGRVFSKKVFELPQAGPIGRGKAVVNLFPIEEGEKVCAYLNVPQETKQKYIMMCTSQGTCKKIELLNCAKIRVNGIRAISLDEDDSLISAQLTDGNCELFFATRNGMGIRIHESLVRCMGRTARGVRGIRLRGEDQVVSAIALTGKGRLLTVTEKGYGKQTEIEAFRCSMNRGNYGVRILSITDRTGLVVNMLEVEEEHQLFIITRQGKLIRLRAKNIPVIGRVTQGARLITLKADEAVMAVARVLEEGEDKPEAEAISTSPETEAEITSSEAAPEAEAAPEQLSFQETDNTTEESSS